MATPSLTKSFDASLIDLQRSFSSTDTNTTGSSAKENRHEGETQARDVRSLTNEILYEQWSSIYDTDGNVLQAVDDIESKTSIPELMQTIPQTSRSPLCILDFGCGTGRTTLKLLNSPNWNIPIDIHAWDASSHMLGIARSKCSAPAPRSDANAAKHNQSMNFRQVDFKRSLPTKLLGQVDLLVSTLVLEHLSLETFWRCVAALLRIGGVGMMSNMHPDMGGGSVAGFKAEGGKRVVGESFVHGIEESVEGARKAGLQVWDVREVAVDEGMIERGEVGERGKKWVGKKIWYGMKFRKPA